MKPQTIESLKRIGLGLLILACAFAAVALDDSYEVRSGDPDLINATWPSNLKP